MSEAPLGGLEGSGTQGVGAEGAWASGARVEPLLGALAIVAGAAGAPWPVGAAGGHSGGPLMQHQLQVHSCCSHWLFLLFMYELFSLLVFKGFVLVLWGYGLCG